MEAPAPQPAPERTPQSNIASLQISDCAPLIRRIEEKRGSRVLCLTYNDTPPLALGLAPAVVPALEETLAQMGRVPKLDLILRTTGGAVEVPWRIVSLLREFTDELGVIVSRMALSAGTHIALAADDLVMGPFAVMGSVDPTRQHMLLPRDPSGKPLPCSVQDLKQCVLFIREQLGDGYQKQDMALIVSELFKYVNPLAVGALEQAYKVAKLITRKVLATRRQKIPGEQVEKIVNALSDEYFSHALQLSRADIETDLGLPVTRPHDELTSLLAEFEGQYLTEFRKTIAAPANPKEQFLRVGALLQTTTTGWGIALVLKADGTPVSDLWQRFR